MGFREGAFATVWEVTNSSDNFSKIRMSTSRKDKKTDEYITDFNGFVSLIGEAHKKLNLIESGLKNGGRCRIKIGACDVSNHYDKEAEREFTNFTMFDFESADGDNAGGSNTAKKAPQKKAKASSPLSDESENEEEDGDLPF